MPINVPPWLIDRFNANFVEDPHYEASYYGPINMLLTTYFSAANHFIVKPQARLQTPAPLGVAGPRDSYGRVVYQLPDDDQPDFVVCKALEAEAQFPAMDVPLLILEAKRRVRPSGQSPVQIERYMQWARDYQADTNQGGQGAPVMQGGQRQINVAYIYTVLSKGGDCEVYELHENRSRVFFYSIIDDAMHAVLLHVLATAALIT